MYHYYTTKSQLIALLSGLVVGLLLLQIITPTIVYGTEDIATNTGDQTTTETLPETTATDSEDPETSPEPTETATTETTDDPETTPTEDPETATTTIETGDTWAELTVENTINLTVVDTATTTEDTDTDPETVVELTTSTATSTSNSAATSTPLLVIETNSNATSTTNATTTAVTGQNVAYGEDVTINTGNAVAYTDVLNVVNTNIVNSDGLIRFVNDTLGYQDFDLRDDFELTYADFDTSQSTPSCNLDACSDNVNTTITSSSTAVIDNDITVVANTGDNQANGEQADINTGDAYAAANVINVANTNITDSNYLLLVFNNFDDYAGDIVLPNSSFFDDVLQTSSGINNTNLDTNNSANINNNVTTVADTGNNSAVGDDSSIATGDAYANSDTTNIVNQNIIGGNSFSMLIRVHGNWSGTITGLPEGLTWRETSAGIEITSLTDTANTSQSPALNQSTNNHATINNNVQVFALTGENEATGGPATVNTGNAQADSSILNIANTNVIGSNWTNLIFTIYGNWSGNLSFGQPNLWLGITADSPDNPIMPGSKVTYTYTVFNHGDTTAPDVTLESIFENNTLLFSDPNNRLTDGVTTQKSWSLGDIAAGETKEFSYTATVNEDMNAAAVSAIPLTSQVYSSQTDANYEDNEETVTIYVGKKQKKRSPSTSPTFSAKFDMTKTASRDLAQPGDIVDYAVSFFNRGGQLYDALLVDTLENAAGEIVQQQTWPLGEIKNWETINITYSMEFDSSMATGTYTNYAQLIGFHESKKKKHQTPYESPIVSHSLLLGGLPAGQVLGATTVCPAYLTEYLKYNEDNSAPEVMKLQLFLSRHLEIELPATGFFNQATEQAVRDFQQIYEDEVLIPWGLYNDSGYVYYTTQKKINEIVCGELAQFPLDSQQEKEIVAFKTQAKEVKEMSRFSFNTAKTPLQDELPTEPILAIAPNTNVRTIEKASLSTPDDELPIPPSSTPKQTSPWSKLKSWWQDLTQAPQIALR